MAFKMKGSPIKLGNIATKSALKQKFGYHDEEGNVIVDATKDIVPAEYGHIDSGFANLAEGVDPNTKMVRQTAWPEQDRTVKKDLYRPGIWSSIFPGKKRRKKMSGGRRPPKRKTRNLVTGGWNPRGEMGW